MGQRSAEHFHDVLGGKQGLDEAVPTNGYY